MKLSAAPPPPRSTRSASGAHRRPRPSPPGRPCLERLGALEEERDRIVEASRFSTGCGDLADRQIVVERYVDGLEARAAEAAGQSAPAVEAVVGEIESLYAV